MGVTNKTMKKQSAIQWLFEQIARRQGTILHTIPFYNENQDLLIQAEKMFAEQIMDANSAGFRHGCFWSEGEEIVFKSPKQYYEENYGND